MSDQDKRPPIDAGRGSSRALNQVREVEPLIATHANAMVDSNPDGSHLETEGQDAHSADTTELYAYLASALTGLDDKARTHIFLLSDTIFEVCHRRGIRLYEPRKVTDPVHHPSVPDTDVFRLDRRRVTSSDLLICLADHPSTGLGQELMFAQEALVPIIVIGHASTRLSRMVTGIPDVSVTRYQDISELSRQLSGKLLRIRPQLEQRRAALQRYGPSGIGARIRELRYLRGMTSSQVAQATNVPAAFTAKQLEEWEQSNDGADYLSIALLREIAFALRVDMKELL